MKQSSPETAKEFGDYLASAERALRRALDILHQQQEAEEYFGEASGAVLQEWAAEVADLAESVRRQV